MVGAVFDGVRVVLETVGILCDDEFGGADLQGALGQDDVTLIDLDLVDVVHAHAVGFKVDRLFAVSLFGMGGEGQGGEHECGAQAADEGRHHGFFLAYLLSITARACASRR